ncbi:MAG TPA: glycine cleavage T C-terminal barrel domain-containing protein [Chthonomonadaceae bacterium]|nr:glycine cleavage T C-terminal barrel domain-containing protein [Chthonomonadaceae bacterium]
MNNSPAEYRAVREAVGLLDRSGSGKLAMRGKDRFSWLQGMVSNDIRLLERGTRRLLACVLNATGHVLTDLALLNLQDPNPLASALGFSDPDFVLADLPRPTLDKIAELFDRYIIMEDVEIEDVSDRLGCFSLQGPRAAELWRPDADNLPETIREIVFAVEADHTGSGGCDLYFGRAQTEVVREALKAAGVIEIGVEAQEVLRMEAGIPRYGAELDESVIALEAGLGPTHISLTKGCYVGQEILARIDSRGHTNRALTGLVLSGPLPTPGDRIYPLPSPEDPQAREVGRITSVAASAPAAGGQPIALGYVRHERREPGTPLIAQGDFGSTQAEVVSLPFFSN